MKLFGVISCLKVRELNSFLYLLYNCFFIVFWHNILSIWLLNRSIWPIDGILTCTANQSQSVPGHKGNEEVLYISQISWIQVSPRDEVQCYTYHNYLKGVLAFCKGYSEHILSSTNKVILLFFFNLFPKLLDYFLLFCWSSNKTLVNIFFQFLCIIWSSGRKSFCNSIHLF